MFWIALAAAIAPVAPPEVRERAFELVKTAQNALQLCLVIESANERNEGLSIRSSVDAAAEKCFGDYRRLRDVYRNYTFTYLSPDTPADIPDKMAQESFIAMITITRHALEDQQARKLP